MGDVDNALPSSKKRAAGRELNRDRPELDDVEDASEQEDGTFKRASDDVLATRRIVKVRRNQGTSAPASNPFAGIRLVVPAAPVPIGAKDEQKGGENKELTEDALQEKNDDTVEWSEEKISTTELVSVPTEEKEGVVDNANDTDPENGTVPEMENDLGKEGVVENTDNLKKPTEPVAENDASTGKNEDKSKDEGERNANLAPLSSFQRLSSTQNAFTVSLALVFQLLYIHSDQFAKVTSLILVLDSQTTETRPCSPFLRVTEAASRLCKKLWSRPVKKMRGRFQCRFNVRISRWQLERTWYR